MTSNDRKDRVRRMPDPMAWLRAGIPLTLVMDLLDDDGPKSERIVAAERPSVESMAWLRGIRDPRPVPPRGRGTARHIVIIT